MPTYIDRLARRVYRAAGDGGHPSEAEMPLYRMYAVLVLAKGEETTRRDVHDAWAAWQAGIDPSHRSLVPFEGLLPRVQALDQPFVEAIHVVARQAGGGD